MLCSSIIIYFISNNNSMLYFNALWCYALLFSNNWLQFPKLLFEAFEVRRWFHAQLCENNVRYLLIIRKYYSMLCNLYDTDLLYKSYLSISLSHYNSVITIQAKHCQINCCARQLNKNYARNVPGELIVGPQWALLIGGRMFSLNKKYRRVISRNFRRIFKR